MKIVYGDIFENFNDGDVLLTTTNGVVKRDGTLVMGAGSAKDFATRFPTLPSFLGQAVTTNGNIPAIGLLTVYNNKKCMIGSFPTKNNFNDKSDLELIVNSAKHIAELANINKFSNVRITAPGVGLGGLDWDTVRTAIEPYLDDRFTIHFKENESEVNTLVKKNTVQPKTFALIIAGSRSFNNYTELERVCDFMLSKKIAEGYTITIISGTAKGADSLGEVYANNRGFGLIRMPADWNKFGKRAGYIRNKEMAIKAVTEFEDGGCIAFRVNGSPGTSHMINLCEELKLKYLVKDYSTK